jgi:hypothetical protein
VRQEIIDNPRRLRAGRQTRKTPGIYIANNRWGSPFRPREVEGQWLVIWTGGEMDLDDLRPPDWQDLACEDRQEAAQLALYAFEDWLTDPAMAPVLDHAREALRGRNLICHCPEGWPCHGDLLLRIVNEPKGGPP